MHKINVKLFAERDDFGPAEFVPVFHRWIQENLLSDHLLIDVADYAHVPDGPGTLLVSSQANIHADREGGRLGMLYVRKQPIDGATDPAEAIIGVLRQAIKVSELLENDPAVAGRLKFSTAEISIRFNDRLLTPNTDEGYAAVVAPLLSAAQAFFGPQARVERAAVDPGKLLQATILPR